MAIADHEGVGSFARAGTVLRAVPEPGWSAIEERVIAAVRATTRGGWPIVVANPAPGTAPGAIAISDLVLRAALARALRGDGGYVLSHVEVDVDDVRALRGVRVELAGRYGADLHAAVARALEVCAEVVLDLVGAVDGVAIDVAVTDIVE
ncbi:hypothetical protein [Mycolicibacterium arseniciresistens]|uniref:Asp23/Gls24 family envelope stress response protein n=1 Tax=Mycolicibacterium arseniciresistens TaxID=3062257 RepID=A0ABT8UN12_9MYCO|nr:hypothetical protein [Mycolicibacterium arseniciresistens]MDO3639199.1 hypothetical protein [Mycolicibacterium arseniciresistens]